MTEDRAIVVYELETGRVELRLDAENRTMWATQADIAEIFEVDRSVVTRHIKNIFEDEELDAESTVQKMHIARATKPVSHYDLDVVIAVGYRVSSKKGTQFRKWANKVIRAYAVEGYALDIDRLENDRERLDSLRTRIREIRLSEQNTYRKVLDVFKESSSDYQSDSPAARSFFAVAQDKFHYAVTQKTALQIIMERASADKPSMGLVTMSGETPTIADVRVGKNYLTAEELEYLENISEQFLLFCESQAMRGKKMTMEELSTRLNMMLMANDYPVLFDYPKLNRPEVEAYAEGELRKYRARLPESARRAISD